LVVKDAIEGEVQVDNSIARVFYDEGHFIELPEEGEFQALILSSEQPESIMLAAVDETILLKLDRLQVF